MMRTLFARNPENMLRISGSGTPEPVGKPRGGLWVVWGRIAVARRRRLNPQIVLRKVPYFPGVTDEKGVRADGGLGRRRRAFLIGRGLPGIRWPSQAIPGEKGNEKAEKRALCRWICLQLRDVVKRTAAR